MASKLIIKTVQEQDLGVYQVTSDLNYNWILKLSNQCTALNNLGKDVGLMELRKRGSLTSGWTWDLEISEINFYFLLPGSLLLSCVLGVALTIFLIVTVYWLRRHFNLNQFYPPHVKLFSKEGLQSPTKCAGNEEKDRAPQGRDKFSKNLLNILAFLNL